MSTDRLLDLVTRRAPHTGARLTKIVCLTCGHHVDVADLGVRDDERMPAVINALEAAWGANYAERRQCGHPMPSPTTGVMWPVA